MVCDLDGFEVVNAKGYERRNNRFLHLRRYSPRGVKCFDERKYISNSVASTSPRDELILETSSTL